MGGKIDIKYSLISCNSNTCITEYYGDGGFFFFFSQIHYFYHY